MITSFWDISLQSLASLEVQKCKERKSWKEKPLSAIQRPGNNHTGIQTFHCRFTKLANSSWLSTKNWQPSHDLILCLHSRDSCAHSAFLVTIISMYCVAQHNLYCSPTFQWVESEWNRLFTRLYFPSEAKYGLETRLHKREGYPFQATNSFWHVSSPQSSVDYMLEVSTIV